MAYNDNRQTPDRRGTPRGYPKCRRTTNDGSTTTPPSITTRQNGLPQRKTIRLKGYDYSQKGLYFITICVQNKLCLFGKINNGELLLNDAGNMIQHQWRELATRFHHIKLHQYIIMPNHFHGIVEIVGVPLVGTRNAGEPPMTVQKPSHHQPPSTVQPQNIRATTRDCPYVNTHHTGRQPTIGHVIGVFKSLTTNDYIRNVKQNQRQRFAQKLWQRNYYEHIIRDEQSYCRLSEYIQTNPDKWLDDQYHDGQ